MRQCCSYTYDFSVIRNRRSADSGSFSEVAAFNFQGDVIWPDTSPDRHAKLTIYPEARLLNGHDDGPGPAIGSVTARAEWLSLYAWLPTERLDGLVAAAAS